MAEEYRRIGDSKSLELAISYHEKELKVCENEDLIEEYIIATRFLGDCFRDAGEIQKAKKQYHQSLALIRQDCQHISDVYEEHACCSSGKLWMTRHSFLAITMERTFFSTCQSSSRLLEYYRSLCNLALAYLNESVIDTEHDRYSESDFHILYRSLPLFERSLTCIKTAEVPLLLIRFIVETPSSKSLSLH